MGRIRAPIFKPNWSHPLNRGRVAWWLCQPNRLGGGTWFDLCGHNHGTLTSMGGASGTTNGFRSTTRPGGWGNVLFDGSAGYVTTAKAVAAAAPLTLKAWFKTSAAGAADILTISNSGDDNQFFRLIVADTHGLRLDGNGSPGYQFVESPSSVNGGTWHHGVATLSGSSVAIYLEGVLVQSGTITTVPSGLNRTSAGVLNRPSITEFFPGSIDDVSIYSRALTAAEVQLDYTLSRQRYPGVLQSMPLRTYSVPSAGPAGNGLLMRRRRFLLGAA